MEDGTEVYSTDGELFDHTCMSDFDIGDYYYKGKSKKLVPSEVMYGSIVWQLMEQLEESVYEECGDVACDNVYMAQDKQDELLVIIKEFLDKNAKISCFSVEDITEHKVEEE